MAKLKEETRLLEQTLLSDAPKESDTLKPQ